MKHFYHVLTILAVVCTQNLIAQPVINSFAPASGPVGTVVTITGNGFNAVPANNTVYFGAVKAVVNTASAVSLTVTVPAGASYQPLTVTTGGLTGYAAAPFIVTFDAGGNGFDAAAFDAKKDYAAGSHPQGVCISDLDGDGKPEILLVNNNTLNTSVSGISIYRNASPKDTIYFEPKLDIITGINPQGIAIGDFDGDGKPDLAVINQGSNTVSVLRNTSTPGSISFAAKMDYATGTRPFGIAAGDVNGDGKVDLGVVNYGSSTLSIFKNLGSPGNISFDIKLDYATGDGPVAVSITDLNGDGPQDIAVTNYTAASISVFRNTTTGGSVSLAPKTDYATGVNPQNIRAGDLDMDGKQDIVIGYAFPTTGISVFRNTATTGNISFAAKADFAGANYPVSISLGDIDGDGKPDVAASNYNATSVSVFRNTSAPGTVSFAAKSDYATGDIPYSVAVSDLDGNGKPDLVVGNDNGTSISILRNKLNQPTIVSFTPVSAAAGATVTITGTNFTGATEVKFDTASAASFTVQSSTTITAVVGNGSSGKVLVTTPHGTASLAGFVFIPAPVISTFTPTAGAGGKDTIAGANFTGATAVSFGGVPASSFTVVSATIIIATVGSGASGDVSVTTPGGTATKPGFTFIPAPVITSFTPTTATIGDVVTITGANFTGAGMVIFNDSAAASFTVVSPTTITAVVKNGSTGAVMVATPGGIATLAGFTYITPPTPVITSFTPTSGTEGDTITITGSHFTYASDVRFGSSVRRASSFTVIDDNTITAVVGTNTPGTRTITVLSPWGGGSLAGFVYVDPPAPVITGFTPSSGPVGTAVVISGANFIATATGNTVYFGAVKATVVNASTTTLTVTVPAGATWQPITVTANRKTAYSATPFAPGFIGMGSAFSPGAFVANPDYPAGITPFSIVAGDFNMDGRIDIAVANHDNNTMSVFNNNNNLVFDTVLLSPRQDYAAGQNPGGIATGDLNGDGKLDLVVANMFERTVSVYLNTSVSTIAFQAKVDFPTGGYPVDVAIGDIDGDGKPDIVASTSSGTVSLLRNTSTSIAPSFEAAVEFAAGYSPQDLSIGDIDGDGKPDIAIASTLNSVTDDGKVSVFRNTSTSGVAFTTASLATKIDFAAGRGAWGLDMGDLDADGKPELVVANNNVHTISVLKNTSTAGNIAFAAKTDYPSGANPESVDIADLDGDGKPDIAVADYGAQKVSVYKNTSVGGVVSLAAKVDYAAYGQVVGICIADIDGDGRPDLNTANYLNDAVTILRNRVGEPDVVPSGVNPQNGRYVSDVTLDPSVQTYHGSAYVQRHYDIVPPGNPATATATITLYFTQQDFDNFNAYTGHGLDLPTGPADNAGKANLRVYQYHGFSTTSLPGSYSGNAVEINPDDNKIVWNATYQWWEISFDVTGFSGFFVSTSNAFLPLDLLSFTGRAQGDKAMLQWVTSKEVSTNYFELQRSTEGSGFTAIARVAAAGNSSTDIQYQYTDTLGSEPIYYYRLKMVDIDGRYTMSGVVTVKPAAGLLSMAVYPNPASSYVTATYPMANKNAQLQLTDISGKVLRTMVLPANSYRATLDVRGLSQGVYRVSWTDGKSILNQAIMLK